MPRLYRAKVLFVIFLTSITSCIFSLWFAVNSDKDNIHPLLNQLIPAGHCACQTATTFQCSSCLHCLTTPLLSSSPTPRPYNSVYDAKNLTLNTDQCQFYFPGLYEDVFRAKEFWTNQNGLSMEDLDNVNFVNGMARVGVYNGDLYVLAVRAKGEDHRRKILAILSAIHRALVTSPERGFLPNTEFVFSIEDKLEDVAGPTHPLWTLTRKASEEAAWLMPDFGLWAWSNGNVNHQIGPYDRVVERVKRMEQHISFAEKQDKLVWRGKLSFAAKMRRALLEASRGQAWSDVKELEWQSKENYLSMEDHCNYKFIAHVEGRSYSASLKYRQACQSVIFAHKLQYIQHHHYLLIPSGPDQNYVEVERDFSDLPSKVQDLLDHPEKAERIASNSISTFRERYLTPAAEACYWRALLDAWTTASKNISTALNEIDTTDRGMRYESFLLLDNHDMYRF